ncbi:MAG: hypothetical protein R3F43_26115 [bacterium]
MYQQRGRVTRQAHVDLPEGTVEEEFGREGFFGRVSHLYRSRSPLGWTAIEGDCRPECLAVDTLPDRAEQGPFGRVEFLRNSSVSLGYARLTSPMADCVRNADGDDVLFVHQGAGQLETDFGPIAYRKGDYLVIPRGRSTACGPWRSPISSPSRAAGRCRCPIAGCWAGTRSSIPMSSRCRRPGRWPRSPAGRAGTCGSSGAGG